MLAIQALRCHIHRMIAGFVYSAALAAMLVSPPPGTWQPTGHDGPVLASGCHRDAQRHYVPEFRDTVRHRHLPGDCRPVPIREKIVPLDCHRDVRKHFVPGMGYILHRHVGNDCSIRRVNRSSEPKP